MDPPQARATRSLLLHVQAERRTREAASVAPCTGVAEPLPAEKPAGPARLRPAAARAGQGDRDRTSPVLRSLVHRERAATAAAARSERRRKLPLRPGAERAGVTWGLIRPVPKSTSGTPCAPIAGLEVPSPGRSPTSP